MADIKWIKIATDIFSDEKVMLIESMPEADGIITIWFKLLCLAGRQNNSGVFTMNDKIAYTDEMLATIFRRPLNTVRLALNTFETFGMIERYEGIITIPNWEKYQNIDGMERIREQSRISSAKYRKKQKALKSDITVTSRDQTDKEEDKEKDKDKDKESKHKHGAYAHVLLKDSEYEILISEYGQGLTEEAITFLDEYIEMKDTKYKSHYLALRKWVFDAVKEHKGKSQGIDYEEMRNWV